MAEHFLLLAIGLLIMAIFSCTLGLYAGYRSLKMAIHRIYVLGCSS